MLKLPQVVTTQNRFAGGLMLLAWIILCYMLPNKFLLRTPQLVPLTLVDQLVHFSPGWIWAYVSYYPYLIAVYFLIEKNENLNRYFYCLLSTAFFSCLFFFAYPTLIMRDMYPLLMTHDLTGSILGLIRNLDESVNCAPSMHITMTTVAYLSIRKDDREYTVPMLLWALLIAYSTMATKQHYFVDVLSGLCFGVAAFNSFNRAEYTTTAFSSMTANN
jgi:membrane-associated phospholipid phosphatase